MRVDWHRGSASETPFLIPILWHQISSNNNSLCLLVPLLYERPLLVTNGKNHLPHIGSAWVPGNACSLTRAGLRCRVGPGWSITVVPLKGSLTNARAGRAPNARLGSAGPHRAAKTTSPGRVRTCAVSHHLSLWEPGGPASSHHGVADPALVRPPVEL